MEQQYATAVWKMVEGGAAPAKAVSALRELLEREGRGALLPRIGKALARIAEREVRRTQLTVTVATEKDGRRAHTEAHKALKEMGIEEKDLKTLVDDTVIGGWRLEGRGVLIDNTYKNKLLSLYNRAVRA